MAAVTFFGCVDNFTSSVLQHCNCELSLSLCYAVCTDEDSLTSTCRMLETKSKVCNLIDFLTNLANHRLTTQDSKRGFQFHFSNDNKIKINNKTHTFKQQLCMFHVKPLPLDLWAVFRETRMWNRESAAPLYIFRWRLRKTTSWKETNWNENLH